MLKGSDAADEHSGTIQPTGDNAIDLGASGKRYRNIYGVTFTGTVTTATYADIAENYTMDKLYPVGTVLCVSKDEEIDLTMAEPYEPNIVGVISESPGVILNNECVDGIAVGLLGRVHIRVEGPIKKSDFLVPEREGTARAGARYESALKFAVALESNSDPCEKLVECFIK